jgi:Ran GTPase-activating protein (RanGAP) involved in mRNA processing and transport
VLRSIGDSVHLDTLELIRTEIPPSAGSALLQMVQSTNLDNLALIGCTLTDEVTRKVFAALRGNQHLKKLSVASNALSSESVVILAETALQNPTLEWLDLSRTGLVDRSAMSLAKKLGLARISCLLLRDNNIGDDGVRAICQALADNVHIRTVDLSGNPCGAPSVEAISQLLLGNTALQTLRLRGIRLGETAFLRLAEVLTHSTALGTLDLRDVRPITSSSPEFVRV